MNKMDLEKPEHVFIVYMQSLLLHVQELWKIDLCFIDFKKAFDWINWNLFHLIHC